MFSIKKIALLSTIALLAACSKNQATPSTPVPEKPKNESVVNTSEPVTAQILVGIDSAYPPYDFRDENGQATGFDVDILKAIGAKQNLQFNFIPERWESVIDNLDKNKFKVAISGFARTSEREQKYQVSNTYAYGQDVIASLENTKAPETIAELKNSKVITLGDSPYIEQLEATMGKGSPNLIGVGNSFLVIKGLVTKQADVAFIDKGVVQHYAKSFPDVKIKIGGKGSNDFDKYELVILANKEETELMQKINAGLAEIVKDGTYSTIYKTWFGEEPKELPPVK